MGIQGLQSFLEDNCRSACQQYDFSELTQEKARPPYPYIVVVDGISCLKHLYGSNVDWISGGQWNEMLRNVEIFVRSFRYLNVEPVVFFNGEVDSMKMHQWSKEQQEKRQLVHQNLSHVLNQSFPPPKRLYFPPPCVSTCLRLAFRSCDVSVCTSIEDVRKEIMKYCQENFSLGVLGHHSDYILLNAPKYFSAEHLKISKKCITTTVFSREEFLKSINLHHTRVALFSSLLGNSYIPEEYLAGFHWALLGPDHPLAKLQSHPGRSQILPPNDIVVRCVADYVNKLPDVSNLAVIMQEVYHSSMPSMEEMTDRLKKSIDHYTSFTQQESSLDTNGPGEQPEATSATYSVSPQNKGKPEHNYQKRWQHWQQIQQVPQPMTHHHLKGVGPGPHQDTNLQQLENKMSQLQVTDPNTQQQHMHLPLNQVEASPNSMHQVHPHGQPPMTMTGGYMGVPVSWSPHMIHPQVQLMQHPLPHPQSPQSLLPTPPPSQQASPLHKQQGTTTQNGLSPNQSKPSPEEENITGISPYIDADVLKVAKKRHCNGRMNEMIYQVLTKGEIRIGITMEDENTRERPTTPLLFRPVRQYVYGLLLDKKIYDNSIKERANPSAHRQPPPSVKEWCVYGGRPTKTPDIVDPISVEWPIPSLKHLWLGTQHADNATRLKAFLSCMMSDTPNMTKTTLVPQRLIILCCIIRYLLQQQPGRPVLYLHEIDAFLAMALSHHLTTDRNASNLSQLKLSKIDLRGVQLAAIFMRGVEAATFANDACGSPIPWELVCPWNYFDGKLFHSKYIQINSNVTLLELCDGKPTRLEKLERLKWCILEGLSPQHYAQPLPLSLPPHLSGNPGPGLLPTPMFRPPGPHLHNMLPGPGYMATGTRQHQPNHRDRHRVPSLRQPVNGRGGTLEVAGVPIAKYEGNKAGFGYSQSRLIVGGMSSVEVPMRNGRGRGRGGRGGRGVSWASDVDRDYDRNIGYNYPGKKIGNNVSQVWVPGDESHTGYKHNMHEQFENAPYPKKQAKRKRSGKVKGIQEHTGTDANASESSTDKSERSSPSPTKTDQVQVPTILKKTNDVMWAGIGRGRGVIVNEDKSTAPVGDAPTSTDESEDNLTDKQGVGRGWWWEEAKKQQQAS